jgi:hypothetical protein
MAPTKQQKAFCAVEYAKTTSVITVQRNFRRQFEVDPPDKNSIKRWHTQLMETGCIWKDLLMRVWTEMDYRLDICRVTKGAHIESL